MQWVPQGARVLDLGCGDGSLLRSLWQEREAPGYGVEIEDEAVLACVANDVNVLQVDLESGLSLFADGSFDCVILSETLQTIHRTEFLLREMLRVGREGIVSFPNFGHWSARLQIALGRMPVSEYSALPVVRDAQRPPLHHHRFRGPCRRIGIRIRERLVLHDGKPVTLCPTCWAASPCTPDRRPRGRAQARVVKPLIGAVDTSKRSVSRRPSLPAEPIDTSARPERIMNQKRITPGNAMRVVSR